MANSEHIGSSNVRPILIRHFLGLILVGPVLRAEVGVCKSTEGGDEDVADVATSAS
jgi:hypothetical protein